jgi:myo-inositol-1(or 4)-monophosphatase
MHEHPSLTTEELRARFLAAQEVAAEAGRLAMQFLNDPKALDVRLKGPQDFLTAADLAVEQLIVQKLSSLFPGDQFLAEESNAPTSFGPERALWVIDPIDGTANFAVGRPDWCISIGFAAFGIPELGVIEVPSTASQYAALRGDGATRNGLPIRASACTSLSLATLAVDYSFRTPPEEYLGILTALLGQRAEHRRSGSAAVSLAQVADGRLDGFVELHLHSWDVMASLVLIKEAGGWVSDFLAHDGLRKGGPFAACAPGIRGEFTALLAKLRKAAVINWGNAER